MNKIESAAVKCNIEALTLATPSSPVSCAADMVNVLAVVTPNVRAGAAAAAALEATAERITYRTFDGGYFPLVARVGQAGNDLSAAELISRLS